MDKIRELQAELKTVFAGRGAKVLDVIVPMLVFLVTNPILGLSASLGAAIGSGILIFLFRIFRQENIYYALGGLGAVLLAAGFALLSGSGVGFFIPGMVSGGLTVLLCLLSVLFKRPLAALSSHLTRSWPLDWYWHPLIRPAYAEVTLIWALGFGIRLVLELIFFLQGAVNALGLIRTVMGWPYTILILLLSYLYGLWRLGILAGPSVDEFKSGSKPPWKSQSKGF